MSMAQSLEVRVPFLDDRLVEWVLALPPAAHARGRKALLLAAVGDTLPPQIRKRTKQGFVLPFAEWLLRELREEVEGVLAAPPDAVRAELDATAIRSVWDEFSSSKRRWLRPWALYALCRWAASIDAVPRGVR